MRFQIYIEFTKNMYSICKYFAKIRKYKILNAECRQMNGGEGGGKKEPYIQITEPNQTRMNRWIK